MRKRGSGGEYFLKQSAESEESNSIRKAPNVFSSVSVAASTSLMSLHSLLSMVLGWEGGVE